MHICIKKTEKFLSLRNDLVSPAWRVPSNRFPKKQTFPLFMHTCYNINLWTMSKKSDVLVVSLRIDLVPPARRVPSNRYFAFLNNIFMPNFIGCWRAFKSTWDTGMELRHRLTNSGNTASIRKRQNTIVNVQT
jgi:hypothetical protein